MGSTPIGRSLRSDILETLKNSPNAEVIEKDNNEKEMIKFYSDKEIFKKAGEIISDLLNNKNNIFAEENRVHQYSDGDDTVLLEFNIPGLRCSDIDVELNQQYVTLKIKSNSHGNPNLDQDINLEYSRLMPDFVDVENGNIKYKNGTLTIAMPKS